MSSLRPVIDDKNKQLGPILDERFKAVNDLLGTAWDDELEVFRQAGEGADVRWLHQVV